MKERDWPKLIHNISKGNCILVLGPDIARVEVDGKSRPLNEILSNELAEEVENDRKVLDRNDLTHTAQLYADFESENDLQLDTVSFYNDRNYEISAVYHDLAKLPFKLVVNATPDKFLIRALEQAEKKYYTDYYNFRGKKREMAEWDSRDRPMIYYLYGSADIPRSLVISEKHLLEYLVAVIANDPPIQSNIASEFRDKGKSFLFLGLGFRNWYLRILLYVLLGGKGGRNEKESRSFALEEILPGYSSSYQQICFLFRKDLKIDFSDMHVDEFVKELRERYEQLAQPGNASSDTEVSKPTIEPDEDAPTVFISYASEDKEKAMELRDRLRAGGYNPWFDKDGLRAGNDWEKTLEKTIDNVDYFVVLQSKALAVRERSVVFKEVRFALSRQDELRDGLSFIMPVKIDDCELMDALQKFHTIDLTDMTNVKTLLKDIRRDQKLRKR